MSAPTFQAADLYGDLEPAPVVRWRDRVPGLLVAVLAAMAAAFLSDHYGAPVTLIGLLIGLAMNFLGGDRRLLPGLAFASSTLLRLGVVLLGLRVTFGQVAQLGGPALLAILLIATATLLAGAMTARALGHGWAFGVLAGGAVAICGASAALAFAAVLGERRVNQAQLALVLVGISALSALAMVAYPVAAHALRFDDAQAGFLFGAAIHDVAQSVGAGLSYSPAAADSATIVKLARVALLAPALAIAGWLFRDAGEARGRRAPLPWFVAGFFVTAALNSAGVVPAAAGRAATTAATALLVCAVTATGLRSRMQTLLDGGTRPLLAVVVATLVSLVLALAAAATLIG